MEKVVKIIVLLKQTPDTEAKINLIGQGETIDETGMKSKMLLQVHDELVFSVSDKKEVEAITKIMEESVSLEVPNKVDAELGKNWGESMS